MAKSGDRIIFHSGIYMLKETLVFGPQHSGVSWVSAAGDLATATVIAPVLERLVSVRGGDLQHRVSKLRFEGITFAHTAYNLFEIGGSHGHIVTQSNAVQCRLENKGVGYHFRSHLVGSRGHFPNLRPGSEKLPVLSGQPRRGQRHLENGTLTIHGLPGESLRIVRLRTSSR